MRKAASLLALAGILTLTACDWGKKKEDDTLPLNNEENMVENNAVAVEEAPVENAAVNVSNSTNAAVPPPPKVSEEQQTLDDADATGLTSRIPEEGTPESAH